jgi:hypothetical protein
MESSGQSGGARLISCGMNRSGGIYSATVF